MSEKTLAERLAEPFEPQYVDFLPQSISGGRCLAVAYIDARAVMDRLDDVFGVGGWTSAYTPHADGVVCRLRVRLPDSGEWCEHEDVGSYSDQKDAGDRLKAGYSDALKRVAVHLAIGRYLYALPLCWVDYDERRKCIARPPKLPVWALPGGTGRPPCPTPTPRPDPAPQPAPPGRPLDATAPPVPPDGVPGALLTAYAPGRGAGSRLTAAEGAALRDEIARKGRDPEAWLADRSLADWEQVTAGRLWSALPQILAARKKPTPKEEATSGTGT